MAPNIDRIEETVTHITNFYQCGTACPPARASLLTGRYNLENELEPPFAFSINPDQPGLHTINVKFISKSGVINAVHGDIIL